MEEKWGSSLREYMDSLKRKYDDLSEISIEFYLLNKKILKYLTQPKLFNDKEKAALFDRALKVDWSMEQFLHGDYKKEEKNE